MWKLVSFKFGRGGGVGGAEGWRELWSTKIYWSWGLGGGGWLSLNFGELKSNGDNW